MYYYLALAVIGYYGYNKYKPKVDMLIIGGTFQLVKIYHAIKDYYGINTEEKNDEIYSDIKSIFHDLNLEDSINANLKKNLKLLSSLESKLIRNKKKYDEDSINQITKIKNELFPNNKLQERNNNFMTYYMKYGDNFFKILKNNLDPLDSNFVVLQK